MERELPIINIERTDFLVDVIKEELKEKANIQNVVGINKMYYVGDGYSFDYDPKFKNHFEHQFSKSFGAFRTKGELLDGILSCETDKGSSILRKIIWVILILETFCELAIV
ncbi:hypothetical protein D0817_23420 [Flavobacterium cupreum]|uniref:Uncharacterized protein n=1 Tax=Flavobacterium cupreum TaxID=2133766 RepID=A0A434A0S3_9FLAO|nr:hypothetical protein [Flavobacterium cupreum]RUT67966.1 hypothetical protein D0817_23420 [Flavobacterium cupreum]